MNDQFLRVGLCSWQKSHTVYFRNFNLLELDSTFYRLPQLKTAERWRAEAPDGFIFTLKAWQIITHEPWSPTYRKHGLDIPGSQWKYYGSFRPGDPVFNAWKDTFEIAQALGAPVVVFQCPVQFTPTQTNIQNMRTFFSEVERGDIAFAWEPRGPDWKNELVRDLCQELNLIHCVDPFLNSPAYGCPRYFRLHGSADYTYKFTDADLELLKTWIGDQDVYCLFNNVPMWEDSMRFKSLMGIK
jgi:uncharacterized protein YecE (DUF72 family)